MKEKFDLLNHNCFVSWNLPLQITIDFCDAGSHMGTFLFELWIISSGCFSLYSALYFLLCSPSCHDFKHCTKVIHLFSFSLPAVSPFFCVFFPFILLPSLIISPILSEHSEMCPDDEQRDKAKSDEVKCSHSTPE